VADLKEELIEFAKTIGADKIGIADASLIKNPPQEQDFDPENYVDGAKCAISICVAFPEDAVGLDDEDDFTFCTSFGSSYVTLKRQIDTIGAKLVKFLEEKGYKAKYIGPELPFDKGCQICGLLHPYIHKLIATIAGLGEEGMSNLLVTPEYGPRVLLASIITDAPLEPDGPKLVGKVCRKCNACVEECPTGALSEENYPPYNFERNRCFWGYFGGMRVTEIDTPPLDWINAKPSALSVLPKYKEQNPRLKELLDWDEAIGNFPKCTRCMSVCPVGAEEE